MTREDRFTWQEGDLKPIDEGDVKPIGEGKPYQSTHLERVAGVFFEVVVRRNRDGELYRVDAYRHGEVKPCFTMMTNDDEYESEDALVTDVTWELFCMVGEEHEARHSHGIPESDWEAADYHYDRER